MSVLVHRCLSRSRLVEELVEDWQIEHGNTLLASDVDELASECLELARLVQHAWASVSDLLFDGKIEDFDAVGAPIRVAINKTQHALGVVDTAISQAECQNYVISHAADLRLLLHEINKVAEDFKKTWPTSNPQMAEESLAAYHRGEYLDSGDVLRAAQSQVSEANQ